MTNFEWHFKAAWLYEDWEKKTKWFFPPHHEKHVQRQTTLNGARLDTGKQGGTHSVLTVSLKLVYSENATKFCDIFPLLLTVCTVVISKGEISKTNCGLLRIYELYNTKWL